MASEPVPCEPCKQNMVNINAEIWCYNCNTGLCSTCSFQHKEIKSTCNHKTIDIQTYKTYTPSIGTIKTECDSHNQQFNLYCPIHLMPCCDECISIHHSKCTGITSLASEVEKTKIEQSKASVEKHVTSIECSLKVMAKKTTRKLKEGRKQFKSIKEPFSKIREEFNQHLDHLEMKLYKEADTVWGREKNKLAGFNNKIEEKKKILKEVQEDLHTVHTSKLHSFLAMHQIERKVHQCRYAVDMEKDEMAGEVEIIMEQNDEIENILCKFQSLESFGEVKVVNNKIAIYRETSLREAQAELQEQPIIQEMTMNIATKTEININMKKPNITDMICLMTGKIIVVEAMGKVNLLTSDGELQKQLPVPGQAWNVTQINQDTIAITFPYENAIKFFNMKKNDVTKLIILGTIGYGLSCFSNSLAVGLKRDEIRIIDLEGNVLKSIQVQSNSFINDLVYYNDRIIYSDYYGNAVYCVDISDKQIWQYNQDLSGPRGICTDNYGNIIVADRSSHRVIVISKDGKNSKVLISKGDGLKDPRSICLNNNKSSCFICDSAGKYMSKFNLSYK